MGFKEDTSDTENQSGSFLEREKLRDEFKNLQFQFATAVFEPGSWSDLVLLARGIQTKMIHLYHLQIWALQGILFRKEMVLGIHGHEREILRSE